MTMKEYENICYQLDLTKRECYNCNCENGYLHNNPYYQSLKHICIE